MSLLTWLKRLFGSAAPPDEAGGAHPPPIAPRTNAERKPTPARRTKTPTPRGTRPHPDTGLQEPAGPSSDLLPSLLQFRDGLPGTPTDIVVGFDFGTSSAKVAIQSPYKLGGRTVFVDFCGAGHASSPYLLPAALYRDLHGKLSLARPSGRAKQRAHLKLSLLDGGSTESDGMAWAAAFCGLALREARRFFLTTQYRAYGANSLRWALNFGIPSAGYDDKEVSSRFLRVARAAWCLSQHPDFRLEDAAEAVRTAESGRADDISIAVVPEVAAEVVGYAKSRHRREGLHLIMDIGASTVDLCAFILHERGGDDVYELLTADVQRLGLLELHSRRMDACGCQPPFDRLPEDIVAPLPQPDDLTDGAGRRHLNRCDRQFIDEAARRVVLRTLTDLRRRRDPNSPVWRDGLPLFVTGGAARSGIASDIVRCADGIARSSWYPYAGLTSRPLPTPDSVVPGTGPTAPDFQRMAVAFGLSFPEINIGTIERPSAIPDMKPAVSEQRDWQRAYIDKDVV